MSQEQSSIGALWKISKPINFPKGTLICREGTPGLYMYIVVQGKVGIYIDTLLDERIKVEEVQDGGFFGEMSFFDKLPRSATCIAIEDTVCIAISRKNLQNFIIKCPELTEKLMLSISARLRDMNDQLYKVPERIAPGRFEPFSIPPMQRPHDIQEPAHDEHALIPIPDRCPVCGEEITLNHIQTYALSLSRLENNMRRVYKGLDVLWHYLWNCPQCGYSNFSSAFHKIPENQQKLYQHLVAEQTRYHDHLFQSGCAFDELIFHYFQAIHINTCLNSGDTLLLAKLWLYLYWLYTDAQDAEMMSYTRERALTAYEEAYDGGRLLKTEESRQQCLQVIAELCFEKGDYDKAYTYYNEVIGCGMPMLARKARDRIYEIRERKRAARSEK